MSLVCWFDEVDFLKCSRSASQLSFTNLFLVQIFLKVVEVNMLDTLLTSSFLNNAKLGAKYPKQNLRVDILLTRLSKKIVRKIYSKYHKFSTG